jgi:hypothetical protein
MTSTPSGLPLAVAPAGQRARIDERHRRVDMVEPGLLHGPRYSDSPEQRDLNRLTLKLRALNGDNRIAKPMPLQFRQISRADQRQANPIGLRRSETRYSGRVRWQARHEPGHVARVDHPTLGGMSPPDTIAPTEAHPRPAAEGRKSKRRMARILEEG